MKLVAIVLFTGLIMLYAYSAYRVIINPDNIFWGYVCAIVFSIASIYGAILFSKNLLNKEDKS